MSVKAKYSLMINFYSRLNIIYCQCNVRDDTFGNRLLQMMIDKFVESIEWCIQQFHADPTISLKTRRIRCANVGSINELLWNEHHRIELYEDRHSPASQYPTHWAFAFDIFHQLSNEYAAKEKKESIYLSSHFLKSTLTAMKMPLGWCAILLTVPKLPSPMTPWSIKSFDENL
jgi:hypothetical protein